MTPKNFAGLTGSPFAGLTGFLGQALGGGLRLLPWQQQMIAGGYSLPGESLSDTLRRQMGAMQADINNIALQSLLANAAKPTRPPRPWALWQFKSGKTATMTGPLDLPRPESGIEWHSAYDRSLGCDVFYAAR